MKADANNHRLKPLNLKCFTNLSHPKVTKKPPKGKHHARSADVEESSGCETSTLAGARNVSAEMFYVAKGSLSSMLSWTTSRCKRL